MDCDRNSRSRRATISYMVVSQPSDSSQPLVCSQHEDGHGSMRRRQAQSWVTSASQRMSSLPQRLGAIGTYLTPRFRRRSIDHATQSIDACHCGYCAEIDDSGSDSHSDYSASQWDGKKAVVTSDNGKASLAICEDREKAVISCEDGKKAMVTCDERGQQLMSVFQIPAYMVESHIWGSYRPLCYSVRECVQSWLYVHSELGNILTHLCGLLIFVGLALVTGPVVVPAAAGKRNGTTVASAADYAIIYTYIGAVLFCLAASAAFHTLACHSQHKHFRALRCDFIGILVLIVGSFVPVGYYGFLHERNILIGYMAMFVVLGIVGVAVSVVGHVEDPRRARWRPIIFMGISGAGLVPVIHGAVLNGYSDAVDRISLWYVVGMSLLYIAGTVIYTFKLPERYRPGKHDVLFHSHQIFHVFVVLAAILHYVGIVRALTWAHSPAS